MYCDSRVTFTVPATSKLGPVWTQLRFMPKISGQRHSTDPVANRSPCISKRHIKTTIFVSLIINRYCKTKRRDVRGWGWRLVWAVMVLLGPRQHPGSACGLLRPRQGQLEAKQYLIIIKYWYVKPTKLIDPKLISVCHFALLYIVAHYFSWVAVV